MSPQRITGAVLLTGRDLDAVLYAVRTTQRSRARDGLPAHPELDQLAAACRAVSAAVSDIGQSDSPQNTVEHDDQQQTTTGQVVGITEAAALLRGSPRPPHCSGYHPGQRGVTTPPHFGSRPGCGARRSQPSTVRRDEAAR